MSSPRSEFKRCDTVSIQGEAPSLSPPLRLEVRKIHSWCFLSPQKNEYISENPIFISDKEYCFGRGQLDKIHPAVSGRHFLLETSAQNGKKSITDISTNGLFLNKKKLTKNVPTLISDGDLIGIKLASSLEDALFLEYVELGTNREWQHNDFKESAKSNTVDLEKLEPAITCPICHQMMHDPIALYPCIHSFCGHCFAKYYFRSGQKKCPSCMSNFHGFQWNHELRDVIEKIVGSPGRSQLELEEADACRKQLQKAIDKRNLEELLSPSQPESQPDTNQTCRACSNSQSRDPQGVVCDPSRPHLICSSCRETMPDTQDPCQSCHFCNKYFCNLIWTCAARGANKNFNNLEALVPTDFPVPWQSIDAAEEEIYRDYLSTHHYTASRLFRYCLDKFRSGDFVLDFSSVSRRVTAQSYVCLQCVMNCIFPEFGMLHHQSLKRMGLITSRPDCPNGRDCLSLQNSSHCQMYNHWCPPRDH